MSWRGETKRSQNQKSWKKEEIIPLVIEPLKAITVSWGPCPPRGGLHSLLSYGCQDLFASLPARPTQVLHPWGGRGRSWKNLASHLPLPQACHHKPHKWGETHNTLNLHTGNSSVLGAKVGYRLVLRDNDLWQVTHRTLDVLPAWVGENTCLHAPPQDMARCTHPNLSLVTPPDTFQRQRATAAAGWQRWRPSSPAVPEGWGSSNRELL